MLGAYSRHIYNSTTTAFDADKMLNSMFIYAPDEMIQNDPAINFQFRKLFAHQISKPGRRIMMIHDHKPTKSLVSIYFGQFKNVDRAGCRIGMRMSMNVKYSLS